MGKFRYCIGTQEGRVSWMSAWGGKNQAQSDKPLGSKEEAIHKSRVTRDAPVAASNGGQSAQRPGRICAVHGANSGRRGGGGRRNRGEKGN